MDSPAPMATNPCNSTQASDPQVAALCKTITDLEHRIDDLQSPLNKKYQETLINQYQSIETIVGENAKVYEWQHHIASNVLMAVVVFVVISGVIFSGWQLIYSMRLGIKIDGTFEASTTNIKITSNIIGLIILGISIAFMLIFVDKVYKINAPPSIPSPAVAVNP